MIGISYAIMACNEHEELELLLDKINNLFDKSKDEIILLLDEYNYTDEVLKVASKYKYVKIFKNSLNNNFSQQKNYLFSKCTKDYIFNLDADEYPSDFLLNSLHTFLENNNSVDMFWVPRINTLINCDLEKLRSVGWNINDDGYLNFPDYQTRIIKNNQDIIWAGKVHEQLTNYETHSFLPKDYEYCIIHNKTLDKQIKQNKFYEQILK